jgi:hypothetical protein
MAKNDQFKEWVRVVFFYGDNWRHIDSALRISYVATDRQRNEMARVTYRDDLGRELDYVSSDTKATKAQLDRLPARMMDCVDCHNRPSHAFESPEWAIDRRITEGSISRDRPFIHKEAVAAIQGEYPTQAEGASRIAWIITDFYRTAYPKIFQDKRALMNAAAASVSGAYIRNVYPQMKIQ